VSGPITINICDHCDFLIIDNVDGKYHSGKGVFSTLEISLCSEVMKKIKEKEYMIDGSDAIRTPTWCPFLKEQSKEREKNE
jgi:hypothetical protein